VPKNEPHVIKFLCASIYWFGTERAYNRRAGVEVLRIFIFPRRANLS